MRIYPPIYALGSIMIMRVLNQYVPLATFSSPELKTTGSIMTLVGFLLILASAYQFKKAKTTIEPFADSSSLITSGLFSLSRNPIYLGIVIILTGIAIAMASITPFIMPVLFTILIHFKFILKEEEHLTKQFGDKYKEYKKSTRRWI